MAFVFTVFARYLFSSRGDRLFGFVTLFSVVGIAIGVAAINTVQAAQNGIIAETLAEARQGIPDITLRLSGAEAMAADDDLLVKLGGIDGVVKAQAFVEGQAAASRDGQTEPIALRGVSADDAFDLLDPNSTSMMEGVQRPEWFLVLPQSMQQRLGVFAGFEVEVISADGQNTALGWTPRSKTFQVAGFHNLGGTTPTALAALEQAQIYLRLKGQWSGIALDLVDSADLAQIIKQAQTLGASAGLTLDAETWEDVNVVQADVFRVMKRVMAIVLALIMVIAAFNILASQLMLVREKRMSIAVFRTMGTGRMQLIAVFVLIGFAIGLGGVLVGMGLTALFAWLAQVLSVSVPLVYAAADLALIATIAVVVCFIATLYPALRAARIDPAIALRDA